MSSKSGLIDSFRELAILLEIKGENPFRCRAYENAARALEPLEGEPDQWLKTKALDGVKGVGKGTRNHVVEWVQAGKIVVLESLRKELPTGLMQLVNIPGMGAKKIKAVWEKLGVDSVEKLEAACKSGEVAELPGFGAKTAEKILAGIDQRRKFSGRHLASAARKAADAMLDHLRKLKEVKRIEVAGSLRRRLETVKDLDFVVESAEPEKVMAAFVGAPGVDRVVNHGATKSSVLLDNGIPADLRVVEGSQFAAALNYFTGGKEHNTHLRGRAKKMGLKLNEYGLFREGEDAPLPCKDEAEIYKRLGLAYVEPELREDRGEIEAAETGALPKLIELGQMRGILHSHSTYSDGKSTLEEMIDACVAGGFEYFGICDHSQAAAYAGGLKEADVLRQHEEIEKLAAARKGFTIFKGIESDILGDGSLDYPDAFLERFDLVVVSIHSRFQMSRDEMTARVCRALEHPAATILAHPTGRLLLEREPYQLDMERVFETAAKHGVAVEINANPHRLDLDWREIRAAKKAGCIFAINPDAHSVAGIGDINYGIGVARKGWLGAEDVINTKSAAEFKKWLKARRG